MRGSDGGALCTRHLRLVRCEMTACEVLQWPSMYEQPCKRQHNVCWAWRRPRAERPRALLRAATRTAQLRPGHASVLLRGYDSMTGHRNAQACDLKAHAT